MPFYVVFDNISIPEHIEKTVLSKGYQIIKKITNYEDLIGLNILFYCGPNIKFVLDNNIPFKPLAALNYRLEWHLFPKFSHIDLGGGTWLKRTMLPKDLMINGKEFEQLWNMHPKEKGTIILAGKLCKLSRYSQVFGRSYYYSGVYHEAVPMIPMLEKIMKWCQMINPLMNGFLVNWYEDNKAYIGAHSDSTDNLVPGSEIISISFGASREMRFQKKKCMPDDIINTKLNLTNGTVVIMGGNCQYTHKHSIPVSRVISGRRINITCRCFRTDKD